MLRLVEDPISTTTYILGNTIFTRSSSLSSKHWAKALYRPRSCSGAFFVPSPGPLDHRAPLRNLPHTSLVLAPTPYPHPHLPSQTASHRARYRNQEYKTLCLRRRDLYMVRLTSMLGVQPSRYVQDKNKLATIEALPRIHTFIQAASSTRHTMARFHSQSYHIPVPCCANA